VLQWTSSLKPLIISYRLSFVSRPDRFGMEARRILSADQLALQEQVLESLSDLIGRGEAILLVGSGCSRPMLPSWSELVEELAGLAHGCIPGGYALPDHAEDELEQLQHIVEAVRSQQDEHRCLERLEQKLVQLFHMNESGPTPLHEVLVALPFRGFLTTNYDRLLERALGPYDGDRAVDAQTDAPVLVSRGVRAIADPTRSETVIHLHGTGNRPHGMVLTIEDYEQAYGLADSAPGAGRQTRGPYARNILAALLMTRQIVFVGFGLRDPFLMRVLRDVTADWWEWDSPIHYAIMPIYEVNPDPALALGAALWTGPQ
jgi:hypothetical protein